MSARASHVWSWKGQLYWQIQVRLRLWLVHVRCADVDMPQAVDIYDEQYVKDFHAELLQWMMAVLDEQ